MRRMPALAPSSRWTANRLKSDVPPPMSTTRTWRGSGVPAASPKAPPRPSQAPSFAAVLLQPGVEGGLRLLEQANRIRIARRLRRHQRQPLRRRIERCGDGDGDVLVVEAPVRAVARRSGRSRRRAGSSGSAPRREPARSSQPPKAPGSPTAGTPPPGRPRGGRARTWPNAPPARAHPAPASWRTGRRSSPRAPARRPASAGAPRPRAGRGTTAASAARSAPPAMPTALRGAPPRRAASSTGA